MGLLAKFKKAMRWHFSRAHRIDCYTKTLAELETEIQSLPPEAKEAKSALDSMARMLRQELRREGVT